MLTMGPSRPVIKPDRSIRHARFNPLISHPVNCHVTTRPNPCLDQTYFEINCSYSLDPREHYVMYT